jgi:hypothetical protein
MHNTIPFSSLARATKEMTFALSIGWVLLIDIIANKNWGVLSADTRL